VLVAPAELSNQRLEFLGDAVLEFVTTHHLFCCFSRAWEGDLTYMRMEMVNNKILATFALRLGFDALLLHADVDRRGARFREDAHAYCKLLADGFKAFLGALYLDAGVDACRQLVAKCLYPRCSELPLRRFWLRATKVPYVPPDKTAPEDGGEELEPLLEFQRASGIQFRHLGLLRQATTHPSFYMESVGGTMPPMDDEGQPMHNQRLEHLGDAALQLVASDYVFHHFPEHQEGKLSLLRSALVNNPFLCDAMTTCGLQHCLRYNDEQLEESGKHRRGMLADAFEAFLGALFLDRQPFGIAAVKVFCEQVIFPFSKRLLSGRRWMDPKMRLYYCLCKFNQRQPTHLHLKHSFRVVEEHGPSHEKMFVVGCYLNGTQVAEARGQSHRDAEMGAARLACEALGLNEGLELAPDLEFATPDGEEAIAVGDEGEGER
jgi:ribonuclease-3